MTEVEMNGKVTAIDLVKKTISLKDELNTAHFYKWNDESKQEYFARTKVGYYLTIKYDADTYLVLSAKYWSEGKDVFAKLNTAQTQGGKFPPRKPRVTVGFTIAIAQYENVKVEVEGKDIGECKTLLGEALDTLGQNHEPTKDLIQRFKARLL
jgi:hypothetical protein